MRVSSDAWRWPGSVATFSGPRTTFGARSWPRKGATSGAGSCSPNAPLQALGPEDEHPRTRFLNMRDYHEWLAAHRSEVYADWSRFKQRSRGGDGNG